MLHVLSRVCKLLYLPWAPQEPPTPRLIASGFASETDISTMIQSCHLSAKDWDFSPVNFFRIRLCIDS
uniref:Macaca fascicularis brain cDNA clone: QtrA-17643, similar to human BDG-29 proten (BDG29), mRNA, RefSeq: NM_015144.1 n=1 Tax=Macaca fascicularis TaxID=9541 RepID=I7GNS4_MACFA|nr:unnamed protein product [Macaca fascicularis]